MMAALQTRDLFGIPVVRATMNDAVALVGEAIARRQRLMIGVVNAAKIVNMHRDPELRHAVLSSDVIFADGASIVLASRALGRTLPERVAGIDLMGRMLVEADRHQYRVFCLGATATVLDRAIDAIAAAYPNAVVAGRHHGYFGSQDEPRIAELVRQSSADILLVAMTSPKKERFLARWGEHMEVPVCHGVGGSFDVLAGAVQRAPIGWQRVGAEWLFRVWQEPGRLWKRYLVTNTLFAGLLIAELGRATRQRVFGQTASRQTR